MSWMSWFILLLMIKKITENNDRKTEPENNEFSVGIKYPQYKFMTNTMNYVDSVSK